jgi:HEAT repeat protein
VWCGCYCQHDRAVDALIAALNGDDSWVHRDAATALGKIGDKRVIPPLVTFLQEPASKYSISGASAAIALEKLEWKPESEEERVNFFVAKEDGDELQRIWDQTKRVLLEDLESTDESLMKDSVSTFISIGNEEIIPILIDELNAIGNKEMAEIYLNCGHATLESAAENWAQAHGYEVITSPGGTDATWGDW